MNRIPLRIIEILLEDDADTVERIMDHLVDEDFPCCDDPEDAGCALLTATATKVYMSEETGAYYEKPEGGLPIHTQDLDDWTPEDLCGEVLTIDQDNDHWILSCGRIVGHDGPHAGDIVWPA